MPIQASWLSMNVIIFLLPEFVPELRQGEKTADRSRREMIQILNDSCVACLDFLGELLYVTVKHALNFL